MGLNIEDSDALIESLRALPSETGWVEFKVNQFEPDNVGKYVSSLSNSAIIAEKDHAYLVFGVENETHAVVGTTVNLDRRKVGSEPYLLWLNKYLDPHIRVQHHRFEYGDKQVEILRRTLSDLETIAKQLANTSTQPPFNANEVVQRALHNALADMQDIARTTQQTQAEAYALVSKRMEDALRELKASIEKPKT